MASLKSGNLLLCCILLCLGSFPAATFAATDPAFTAAPSVTAEIPATSEGISSSSDTAALPDAPEPTEQSYPVSATGNQSPAKGSALAERFLNTVDPGYLTVGDKWDVTINKGEKVRPFTRRDKMQYAFEEEWSAFSIFEGAYSAGYEHLRDTDPHFGSDKAGYGERFGAAMFRQGTYRLLGNGVFPSLFHEDPRYYRVADGSFWHRTTQSALQVVVSHRDDGSRGLAYSTVLGEVVANTLPLTFYPQTSVTARVALVGTGISLVDDAALKLFREFAPDIFRAAHLIPPGK